MRNFWRVLRVEYWGPAIIAIAMPAVIGVLNAPRLAAQAPAAAAKAPAFEVESVKPNNTPDQPRGGSFAPGRFTQTRVTLRQLIQMAYSRCGFDARQIAGPVDVLVIDRAEKPTPD